MLFQTVLVPTTILASHSSTVIGNNFASTGRDNNDERHPAQRRLMANLYIAGSNLLNSSWSTETTQSLQKEQQAQRTTLFQWYEQRKSAAAAAPPVPIAAATTTPRIRIQSHPTQSELVQRFVSVFSPLSTATRFAACEPEEPKKAPEPTWGRWFN